MDKDGTTIWGDLGSIAALVAMFVASLYGLQWLGFGIATNTADIVLLGGALLSLALSAIFNIYASKGHAYHRYGFELCGLTLGTCLSLLTAQLLSGEAALPRLGHVVLGPELTHAGQVAVVSLLGFFSVMGLSLTALIVRAVDHDTPAHPNGLSLLSFLVGFSILFGYVAVLLGAGA